MGNEPCVYLKWRSAEAESNRAGNCMRGFQQYYQHSGWLHCVQGHTVKWSRDCCCINWNFFFQGLVKTLRNGLPEKGLFSGSISSTFFMPSTVSKYSDFCCLGCGVDWYTITGEPQELCQSSWLLWGGWHFRKNDGVWVCSKWKPLWASSR